MQNRIETLEIITAIDKKVTEPEKLSILFSENAFTIYIHHRLARASLEEVRKIIDLNASLLSKDRTKYDIIAEYLLNKLNRKSRPYPDIQESPKELLRDTGVN